MITVNNQLLMTDEMEILNELKHELSLNGVDVFHKFVRTTNNIQTTCPFHKGGQERKPSFGILTKDRGKQKAGTCHCFACGWAGSFEEMVSNCFGYDDMGNFGIKWIAKNFQSVAIESRPDIDLGFEEVTSTMKYVSDEEYDVYRVYHPYMWTRKMTPDTVDIFDIGYDAESKCITFPVKDEHGNILFIARRSVQSKFFNYPADVYKPIYGLYELNQLEEYPDTIYITESMIDAITIWGYGKYAVALNGLGSEEQYKALRQMKNRAFVLATDNDSAGLSARLKLRRHLPNKLLYDLVIPAGKKDINDLSKEEFLNCKILI
jgi:DNA primase